MNELLGLARWAWSERLGWTILHSLWQIAAITALFAVSAFLLRRSSSSARYALGCISLVAMVALPLATFGCLGDALSSPPAATSVAVDSLPADSETESPVQLFDFAPDASAEDLPVAPPAPTPQPSLTERAWSVPIGRFLPWISGGWMLGVLLFSLRPLLGLMAVRRLRSRGLSSPPANLARLTENLVRRFAIRRPVQLAQSALVRVPSVVGYLRPIVLLPASAITGLSPDQIEQILAHELAHVRRHDYLVNVVQTGIEALLFYHPCMWWVSSRVRVERENCCDDMAVQLCGNRDAYLGALLALEEQRASGSLALAATGGSLLVRARRLISPTAVEPGLGRASAWLAAVLPMGAVALLFLLGSTFAADSNGNGSEPPAAALVAAETEKEAGTEAEPAKGPAAPDKPATGGQAEAKPDQPQPNVDTTKSADGGKPAAAESDAPKIVFEVALEDNAPAKLKIVLLDTYSRPVKTWENVEPGEVRLDLPEIEDDRYSLEVTAEGFSRPWCWVDISREGIDVRKKRFELFRRRYAVLRYAVNMAGNQELEGPDVKEGRVAISDGNTPDLNGDWSIVQQKGVPTFRLHMIGVDNGFLPAPENSSFEDLKRSPDADQFQPEQNVPLEKGTIFFNRIIGNGPKGRKFAKILVEDIIEKPPADMPVIDFDPRAARDAANAKRNAERAAQAASGKPAQPATAPARAATRPAGKLPGGEGRLYAVLRYVVNLAGKQELEGPDVKEGRVAIASGDVPDLPNDWIVVQDDGVPAFRQHRMAPGNGFAFAPPDAAFDDLKRAPDPSEYRPEQNLAAEKGMILFNHILGNTKDPKGPRYAKILIEDLTETPPAGMTVIDTIPAGAFSARKPANKNRRPPAKIVHADGQMFVIFRYAVNVFGRQELEGRGVRTGRAAIASGQTPDLRGDWIIQQVSGGPVFHFHRSGRDTGFASGPPNTSFDAMKRAPDPVSGGYAQGNDLPVEKGMILFDRIVGDDGKERYAKIQIEDITASPPADLELIDTFPGPPQVAARPAKEVEPARDTQPGGELPVTVDVEDEAKVPIKFVLRAMSRPLPLKVWEDEKPGQVRLQLPPVQQGMHTLVASADGFGPLRTLIQIKSTGPDPAEVNAKLYRLRYTILRYAMNTKGERNLTGDNVKEGRIAVLIGELPELRDWFLDQIEGKPTIKIMRISPYTGFALAHKEDKFEDLDRAPANDAYSPTGLPLEKGMILYNRVTGARPEDARYAKLLVEEITEKRPEDLQIINTPGMSGSGR